MTRRNRNIVLVGAVLPVFASNVDAANKTWAAAATGTWTTAAAWLSAGAPINGDTVLINQNSASSYLVNYDNPSTTQIYPLMILNNTGGGAAQLRTAGGTVYNVNNAIVGDTGEASWQIGSATANIGSLNVGSSTTGTGTVSLSSGTLDVAGQWRLGLFGSGMMTQTAGAVFADSVNIGANGTGSGTYQMNGGSLNVTVSLGVGPSGSGQFNHGAGAVNTGGLNVGNSGDGTYTMSGGSVTANSMQLGGGPSGTGRLLISNGVINVGSADLGFNGGGTIVQSAGTLNVTGTLRLPGGSGTGLYDMQGGRFNGGSIVINTGGHFTQSSGTNNADSMTLNGGTYSHTGGSNFVGTFTHNSGTVNGVYVNNGTFIYNGGTFDGRLANFGAVTLNADLTLGDGLANDTTLTIASGRTVVANGQGFRHGVQTFFLLGNLDSTVADIAGVGALSNAVFAHQNGVHNVSSELLLGDAIVGGGAGTYNLNNGTLNANAVGAIGVTIGITQPGQLNLVNGRANLANLRLGNGAPGVVNHTGGGDLFATTITIGNPSAGTYTQNSAGATVNASNGLIIGSQGRYFLTNGGLTAAQTSNNGSFTQTGGTANLNQVSGTGRMDITNTASLTVDRIRNDFLFVADTARIFTTANGSANGLSRLNSLFFEDFENLNFFGKWDLNNNDLVIDTDLANQPDEYDRTKRYIQSGFSVGSWTGNGLNSSAAIAAAATTNKTGLGYARAADVLSFSGGTATFVGQTVDDTTVLVRYTLLGDGDLDGTVDITDFAFLASNFNTPGDWRDGDFNYDFQVNISDFALLASNFNKVLAGDLPRGAAVPEPVIGTLLGALVLGARKRR